MSELPSFLNFCSESDTSGDSVFPDTPYISSPINYEGNLVIEPGGETGQSMNLTNLGIHPGPPWFRWREDSGHSGYRVVKDDDIFQCPYIRYGVFNGISYKMRTKGVSQEEYKREIHMGPHPPMAIPGIND
jgi:hypothetical protein